MLKYSTFGGWCSYFHSLFANRLSILILPEDSSPFEFYIDVGPLQRLPALPPWKLPWRYLDDPEGSLNSSDWKLEWVGWDKDCGRLEIYMALLLSCLVHCPTWCIAFRNIHVFSPPRRLSCSFFHYLYELRLLHRFCSCTTVSAFIQDWLTSDWYFIRVFCLSFQSPSRYRLIFTQPKNISLFAWICRSFFFSIDPRPVVLAHCGVTHRCYTTYLKRQKLQPLHLCAEWQVIRANKLRQNLQVWGTTWSLPFFRIQSICRAHHAWPFDKHVSPQNVSTVVY